MKIFFRSDVHTSIDSEGCLVVTKFAKRSLTKRTLVVIPDHMCLGLLCSLHINLGHPTKDQLHLAVNTRFFMVDLVNRCRSVTESCTLCTAVKTIPDELHDFKTNTVPDHPGKAWTIDVLRECSKLVMVAVCNFSGYVSTTFIVSEKQPDLQDGIITAISPFMTKSLLRVRVDRAPGFGKLSRMNDTLKDMGIDIELGDAKNKNSLALADQRMKELRLAIKKVAPNPNVLNRAVLARATTIVNETIRHHKMSSKEILFSRSQVSSENLKLKTMK